MDLLTTLRPAFKLLTLGGVKLNFGLKETRAIQLTTNKILEYLDQEKEVFMLALSKKPSAAIGAVLNELLLKDWDNEKDEPGPLTMELLNLLTYIFKCEVHLKDLEWLDIMQKLYDFEDKVQGVLKDNFLVTGDITPKNTPENLPTTKTELKQPRKEKKTA